jgi:hypothetical protein
LHSCKKLIKHTTLVSSLCSTFQRPSNAAPQCRCTNHVNRTSPCECRRSLIVFLGVGEVGTRYIQPVQNVEAWRWEELPKAATHGRSHTHTHTHAERRQASCVQKVKSYSLLESRQQCRQQKLEEKGGTEGRNEEKRREMTSREEGGREAGAARTM